MTKNNIAGAILLTVGILSACYMMFVVQMGRAQRAKETNATATK